jgi:hypothetical protein
MADEVPHAVTEIDGVKYVNYASQRYPIHAAAGRKGGRG